MQIARIFGQIAAASASISAALGIRGLRVIPIAAPIILFTSASFALLSSFAWALESLAGGDSGLEKKPSELWIHIKSTLKSIKNGQIDKASLLSFKGALFSIIGAAIVFTLLLTPAGAVAAIFSIVAEAMFVASAAYWYRSSRAEHAQYHEKALNQFIIRESNKAGLDPGHPEVREQLSTLFEFSLTTEYQLKAKQASYGRAAATFAGAAIFFAAIPIVGALLAGVLALASGVCWLKSYHCSKALKGDKNAQKQAQTIIESVQSVRTASPRLSLEPQQENEINAAPSSPAAPKATGKPHLIMSSAYRKPLGVDPSFDNDMDLQAKKLNQYTNRRNALTAG